MDRKNLTCLGAGIVSLIFAYQTAGCTPGLIVATAINFLIMFPLTMAVTFVPYTFYFLAGKKAKFPAYYYAIALILVTIFMLPRHF